MADHNPDLDIDDEDEGGNKEARFTKRNKQLIDSKWVCDTTEIEEAQRLIDSSEKLTDFPQVISFLDLIVSGHTQREAAKKAAEFYKKDWVESTCDSWASNILKDPDVMRELKRKRKEAADAANINPKYILNKMDKFVDRARDEKAAAAVLKDMGRMIGAIKPTDQAQAAPIVNVTFGACPEDIDISQAPEEPKAD
jgi:hypothetical protein